MCTCAICKMDYFLPKLRTRTVIECIMQLRRIESAAIRKFPNLNTAPHRLKSFCLVATYSCFRAEIVVENKEKIENLHEVDRSLSVKMQLECNMATPRGQRYPSLKCTMLCSNQIMVTYPLNVCSVWGNGCPSVSVAL